MSPGKRTAAKRPPLVVPFRSERFAPDMLSERLAPPYDVITEDARNALETRDPYNIVRLILPRGDEDRYRTAARRLAAWRSEGILVEDDQPAAYVVRQAYTGPDGARRERTGVIGAVAVEPFGDGRIKPHERTHAGPKEDRLALLRATQTMFEGLLMLSRDEGGTLRDRVIEATERRPLTSAQLGGVAITVWRVPGRRGERLARAAGRGPLYLADGHHRYETAVAYRGEHPAADRTLGLIVPLSDPGLDVWPTHRLIVGSAIDAEAVLAELQERFQLRTLAPEKHYVDDLTAMRKRGTACIIVFPGGRAVALLLKGGASLGDLPFANEPTVASLDVARVDEIVVKRLRGAAGAGAQVRYESDATAAIDAVRRGQAAAGVLLNPATVEQVLAVADAGAAMPQKSTYFIPKVPSGLVLLRYRSGSTA
jgi:uncharacterized protein (DUF1015 family)